MMKSSMYVIIFLVVVFDAIPQWTSSSPVIRVLRSPDTTTESHISNFLHQHRADSRADKPELKPDNSTDPQHRRPSKPKSTTTEAPVSQTELLVNLIHNTIVTVRDQFPALIGAISNPSNPPTTTIKHPKKVHHTSHQTHAHIMQERSTNATSGEEDMTESSETSAGSGEAEEEEEEEEDEVRDGEGEDEDVEEIPQNNNPAALIPPALIRTIVEASGSSAVRGSAGASAGSAASTIAGASSSSSSGTGRSARQVEEGSEGSGSGEFLFSLISSKIRGLTALFLSPIFSASRFFQRSFGALSSGSGGINPEPDNKHGHRHSDDDHHSHHHASDHHNHEHHDHRSGDHHSDGHDNHSHHHSADHGHHSGDHNHHSGDHNHHSGDHNHHSGDHNHGHHHNSTPVDDTANLILGPDEMQDNGRKFYYREAPYNITDMNLSGESQSNETIANEISSDESASVDGPLRIVLINGGQGGDDGENDIQRRIIG